LTFDSPSDLLVFFFSVLETGWWVLRLGLGLPSAHSCRYGKVRIRARARFRVHVLVKVGVTVRVGLAKSQPRERVRVRANSICFIVTRGFACVLLFLFADWVD